MTELRSVTVKFDPAVSEQIKKIAEKRGDTISGTIRYLIKRGLDERVYEENIDIITKVVREQVEHVFRAYALFLARRNTECPEGIASKEFERVSLVRTDKNKNVFS